MRCVVAVPARLESARLPGKVMADIGGKPMLQWVLERCRRARRPEAVVLCTDNDSLMRAAAEWGFAALATETACRSGSERIASVVDQVVALGGAPAEQTVILNVQGDQPFVDPATIDALAEEFERRGPNAEVLTPVYPIGAGSLHDPDIVKALVAADGRALYFSRSAIPHVRGVDPGDWHHHGPHWGHVGLYAYRADVLARWHELPHSPLEEREQLEQLRLLEAGIQVGTVPVQGDFLAVDTPGQLERARAIAAAQED
jgi:3-deoxy-manno-octulosonate cytidylyltransferase (CMP-KDO synthetase)